MGKYSEYGPMKENDPILKEFPGLRKEDLEEVNGFFEPYLFFENVEGGRKVWTSCCHHEGELWPDLVRTETPEHRMIKMLGHNDETYCPYCHRPVRVKNVRKMGKGTRLEEYIPVLFLHAAPDGETVYAQGYWAWKNYATKERWASPPLYMVTRVFRFRRGEWLAWSDRWVGEKAGYKMLRDTAKWIGEPFTNGSGMMVQYCGYQVIGLDRLSGSFLQYTGIQALFEDKSLCSGFVRTLALASLYPEGVEMLLKAGMKTPIDDWVWRRKKNSKAIKWGETDPRKVFDLNSQELKEFLAGNKNLDVLEIYKVLRKNDPKISIKEVESIANRMGMLTLKDVGKTMKQMPGLTLRKLTGYFKRFQGPCCHGMGNRTLSTVARTWLDYIAFAKELGYDLKNPIIQTPKNLDLKHAEAYQAVEVIHAEARRIEMENIRREEAKRRKKQDEEEKKRDSDVHDRVEALTKRYGFESEHYLIRPPESAMEIVEEGRTLCHCVGGYAPRHASGAATILFLRNKDAPEAPLCTIEMRGNAIVQIHGYRNDAEDKVGPKMRYREILDPWLVWIEAGSKRDKLGRPKLPKKAKEVNVA